jgi:23S rRNA (cytidine1920-2'-O)/16S rRNA (cytidine1409-2'-O)-methyltransferase
MPKIRLDILLVEKKFFPSRGAAQAAIMAGLVFVDGCKIEKAGAPVAGGPELAIEILTSYNTW